MSRKLVEIAAEIVQNQVSGTPMSSDEISSSLRKVFSTLQELQKSEVEGSVLELDKTSEETRAEEKAQQQMSPPDSIQQDKVICLECGTEMRQLTARHLASHGITPREYRKKYGFPMKTPLSAKSLTKARSKAAKKRGLPEKLVQFIEARKQQKALAAGTETPAETTGQEDKAGSKTTPRPRRRKKIVG